MAGQGAARGARRRQARPSPEQEMQRRMITGVIGMTVFFLILRLYGTVAFTCVLAFLAAMASWELVRAAHVPQDFCLAVTPAVTFLVTVMAGMDVPGTEYIVAIYGITLMGMTVLLFGSFRFRHLSVCMLSVIVFPRAFLLFGHMGNYLFLIFLCACAWGMDTGGYLFGIRYGCRKLYPSLSPGKTIEGLAGGFVMACVAGSGVGFLMLMEFPEGSWFHILFAIPVMLLTAAAAALGDLFASAVKREFRVKDFGSVMPGHGGILDRFDSVLLAAPVCWVLLRWIPVFTDPSGGNLFVSMLFSGT